MSKRGNPDHWKTDGHPAADRDLGEQSKQKVSSARRSSHPIRAAASGQVVGAAESLNPPPVHGPDDLPWRVTRVDVDPDAARAAQATRQAEQAGTLTAPRPTGGLLTRGRHLLARGLLVPLRTVLALSEALIERVIWRLEQT
jgi:hypothetical protein